MQSEMYHKITDMMGKKVRYALTLLLVFIFLPGLTMNVRAGDVRQFIHPADSYSLNKEAPGIDQRVRLARGVILIAKKSMTDPNFAKTVLLITEYEETGTVGLILNRPLEKPVVEILPQLQELVLDSLNLHLGGPVRLNSLRLLVQTGMTLENPITLLTTSFKSRTCRAYSTCWNETGESFAPAFMQATPVGIQDNWNRNSCAETGICPGWILP